MLKIPESLYRYRRAEGKALDKLKQLVLGHELYLNSPSWFNDPFDAKVDIDFSGAEVQDWRRFFRHTLKAARPDLSYSKREQEVTRSMTRKLYQDPAHLSAMVNDLQTTVDRVGIACFSEIPDNILMWSHYADSHKGVCIEFDRTQDDSIIAKALPVNYSPDYKRIKAFGDDDQKQAKLVLLTKSKDWSYEREWRIIDYEGGVGIRSLHPASMKSIILGCSIEPATRDAILSWLSKRTSKLKALQAKKNNKNYGLDFEVVEIAV